MDKLYDYLFHYNHHTGYWNAFKRENYVPYFNGTLDPEEVLKNKSERKLIQYISKLK